MCFGIIHLRVPHSPENVRRTSRVSRVSRAYFVNCCSVRCMQTREVLLGLLLVRPAYSLPRAGRGSIRGGGVPWLSYKGRARCPPRYCSSITSHSATSAAMSSSERPSSIHWFRKGLRLHDNRALLEACDGASSLFPLFVMDSDPRSPESRAGNLRQDGVHGRLLCRLL